MRSILITLLFLPTIFNVVAQNVIESALNEFTSYSDFENASIGFAAYDLENNKLIASNNYKVALPTASTAKLFSTASAIELLGPNYKPTTKIYYDGYIDSANVLYGNIWIRGGGDPTLGSKYFTNDETKNDFLKSWSAAIEALGIQKINGNIIADASEFGYTGAPGGWPWNDLGNYYGAGPSGLTIYDNLLQYVFSVPKTAGELTTLEKLEPYVPNLVFHNYVKSSTRRGDNCYLFGGPYSLDRFGEGTLQAGVGTYTVKGSIPDPEHQMAFEFFNVLKSIGIQCDGEFLAARKIDSINENYSEKHLISNYQQATIQEIVNLTNYKSINLFAEQLVCLVGYNATGDGSTYNGLKQMETFWTSKINTVGLSLTDGSGLSRSNGIAPMHFIELLKYMHHSKNNKAFLESLPVSGESGTLTNVCRSQAAHGRISAKSGTMNRIKSYAGYIRTKTGKTLAFSVIVNNANCSTSIVKKRMESLFNKMVSY